MSHGWMWGLARSRFSCTMAGIFKMGKGLFNPWFLKQITLNTLISWKESKQSSLNVDSIKELSEGNVPANVIPIKLTAATNESSNSSQTFNNRNLWFRKSLRWLAIFASSCQNSIANSTSLSSSKSGVLWRSTFVKIVITHLTHSRRIFQKPWSL